MESGCRKGRGREAGRERPEFEDHSLGFPGSSDSKEFSCNVGDLFSIPGLGRSPGEGNGRLPGNSCLENPMDRRAWWTPWGHKELDSTEWLTLSLSEFKWIGKKSGLMAIGEVRWSVCSCCTEAWVGSRISWQSREKKNSGQENRKPLQNLEKVCTFA